ncbi:MAG: hypothetical protein ACERLM_16000, partial [Acidimicrobiales bacterium]
MAARTAVHRRRSGVGFRTFAASLTLLLLLVLLPGASIGAQDPSTGPVPVVLYEFGEGSGSVVGDSSGV